MAFTLAQLEALDEAIATGAQQVSYGNKIVIFKSMDDMLKARNLMAAELGLLNKGTVNDGRTYGKFNKGLHSNNCNRDEFYR